MVRGSTLMIPVLGGLLGGAVATALAESLAWKCDTRKAVGRLETGYGPGSDVGIYTPERVADLPACVARYFEYVLAPGQRLVRSVRIRQAGEIRLGRGWRPFTAVQHVSTVDTGFLWLAEIQDRLLGTVHVRDGYLDGKGRMQARFGKLLTLADRNNRPEMDAGALHRYLAEAVWFPTALLPSERLYWSAIEHDTARATLTHGDTSVSLDFQFDESGRIIRAFTPNRYREDKNKYLPTPWVCRYSHYTEIDGMKVPVSGETEWLLPKGARTYARLSLVHVRYAYDR